MITLGIDIGSVSSKAVLMDDKIIQYREMSFSGYNTAKTAEELFKRILERSGIREIPPHMIAATGYGRKNVSFAGRNITEITCHGKGAFFLDNSTRTVIDIGGQDSKVIALDDTGNVVDFIMNDKCAAGTGRFLEVMARALEVDLESFADISISSSSPVTISSICTVFAESEVVSNIAKGNKREDIAAGIHNSVATRVISMANRVSMLPDIMMTGGVAKNKAVVAALERLLEKSIKVHEMAQFTGAIGAAILAAQHTSLS